MLLMDFFVKIDMKTTSMQTCLSDPRSISGERGVLADAQCP